MCRNTTVIPTSYGIALHVPETNCTYATYLICMYEGCISMFATYDVTSMNPVTGFIIHILCKLHCTLHYLVIYITPWIWLPYCKYRFHCPHWICIGMSSQHWYMCPKTKPVTCRCKDSHSVYIYINMDMNEAISAWNRRKLFCELFDSILLKSNFGDIY